VLSAAKYMPAIQAVFANSCKHGPSIPHLAVGRTDSWSVCF